MNYFLMPGLKERPVYKAIYKDRDTVTNIVCHYFDTDINHLRVKNRDMRIVMVRHICFYLLYDNCGMSYQQIANYFAPSVSNHSTVLHGVKLIRDQLYLKHDNEIKTHLQNIGL